MSSGIFLINFNKNYFFTALRWDTEIKINLVTCFQNQAFSKLNTTLTLEPNTQKLFNNILSHIFPFLLGKRVDYQCYLNPLGDR